MPQLLARKEPSRKEHAPNKAAPKDPELTRLTRLLLKRMGKSPNAFTCKSAAKLLNVNYTNLLRCLHVLEGIGLLIRTLKQYKFNTKQYNLPIFKRKSMVHHSCVVYQYMRINPGIFYLSHLARQLNIHIRRMFDIIAVLKVFGAVKAKCCGFYEAVTRSTSKLYWKQALDDIWITPAKQLNSGAATRQVVKIADTPTIVDDDKLKVCKIDKTPEPVFSEDDLAHILEACQSKGISEIVGILGNKLIFVLKARKIDENSEIVWIVDDKLTCVLQGRKIGETSKDRWIVDDKLTCVLRGYKIGETSEIRWIVDTVQIKCLCDLQSLSVNDVNLILDSCVLHNNSDVVTKDSTAETLVTLSDPYKSKTWSIDVDGSTALTVATLNDPLASTMGCINMVDETVAVVGDPYKFEWGRFDLTEETGVTMSDPY